MVEVTSEESEQRPREDSLGSLTEGEESYECIVINGKRHTIYKVIGDTVLKGYNGVIDAPLPIGTRLVLLDYGLTGERGNR